MHDWDEICRKNGPLVWTTVYRVLNDHAQSLDCYQDVFLEAFEQTRDRTVDHWPSLLRWLALRRAIDRLRQRRRAAGRVVASWDLSSTLATTDGPVEAAQLNELIALVCDEIARLPRQQAETFWMRCIDQMSYAEIADQLGIDANQVGVLIHRARSRLRTTLAHLNPNKVRE